MSTKYFATISDPENDEFITHVYGTFPVVNFAVKAGLKDIENVTDGDYSARIVEVENIGEENEKRTVVSITGDAETVAVVVKRKMATERKQYNEENPKPVSEDAEDADKTETTEETVQV